LDKYNAWVAEILSAENKKQLWIPKGFAHVFLTLSETAEFLYKTTDYYAPQAERKMSWDDSSIEVK
jgi:dTDP-4-dehydrorhamnose 3,5-epimerase